MHEILIDKKKRKIAASWNDLTLSAVRAIIKILHSEQDKNRMKVRVLRHLLHLPNYLFYQINAVQICQLLRCTDFIFADNRLTKNLLPSIKIGWIFPEKYYGPGDDFKNLKFAEFITADTCYTNFLRVKDPKAKEVYLNRFIAALYRERKPETEKADPGDKRASFNSFSMDSRVKYIRKMSPIDKEIIRTWYQGCRNHFESLYPYFFSKDNQTKAKKGDWRDVMLELPNEKFGTLDNIEDQYVHQVFYHMNRTIRLAQEQKEK